MKSCSSSPDSQLSDSEQELLIMTGGQCCSASWTRVGLVIFSLLLSSVVGFKSAKPSASVINRYNHLFEFKSRGVNAVAAALTQPSDAGESSGRGTDDEVDGNANTSSTSSERKIRRLIRTGRLANALAIYEETLQHHQEKGEGLTIRLYNALLSGCAKRQKVDLAERLYREMTTVAGLSPDGYTLSILVDLCARSRRMDEALRLVDRAEQEWGLTPGVVTYNALMAGFARARRHRDAERLFRRMEREGPAPDNITYTSLMSALAYSRNADVRRRVGAWHERMQAAGYARDIRSLNVWLLAAGDLPESLARFREILASGVRPNLVTYNTVLGQHALAKDMVGAEAFFARHLERFEVQAPAAAGPGAREEVPRPRRRHPRTPDAYTYQCMIQGYGGAQRPLDAVAWLDRMQAAGLRPSVKVWGTLIHSLLACGELEAARDFVAQMPYPPNRVIRTSFLSAHVRRGDLAAAEAELAAMRAAGQGPNTVTYHILINTLLGAGRPAAEAEAVLARMAAEGVLPTPLTVSLLLGGHLGRGELAAAGAVLARAGAGEWGRLAARAPRGALCQNAMIGALVKRGDLAGARARLEALEAAAGDGAAAAAEGAGAGGGGGLLLGPPASALARSVGGKLARAPAGPNARSYALLAAGHRGRGEEALALAVEARARARGFEPLGGEEEEAEGEEEEEGLGHGGGEGEEEEQEGLGRGGGGGGEEGGQGGGPGAEEAGRG